MIIELPVLPHASAAKRYRMGFFHFSNNNLAIRKQCAEDVGGYDDEMLTSEDVDICFRTALSDRWVACREPGVIVRHRNRRTVRAMVKQLWGWGINLGQVYRKTGRRGIYLYWVSASLQTITHDIEIEPFPFLVCGFFTLFQVAHVLLLGAVVGLALGSPVSAVVLAALAGVALFPFLRMLLGRGDGLWGTIKLVFVSYLADVTFMTAAFLGSLKAGILFFPAPIFPTRAPFDLNDGTTDATDEND